MAGERLRIEEVLVRDLHAFARAFLENPDGQRITPITEHRALAQSRNPVADDTDVGLLVAFYGDLCVGYQGVMPGTLRTRTGAHKMLWCTAAFVQPEFRKKLVAIHLIKRLMSLRADLAISGLTDQAARVLKGLHFVEIDPLPYTVIRLSLLDPVALGLLALRRLLPARPGLRRGLDRALELSYATVGRLARRAFHASWALRRRRVLDGWTVGEVERIRADAPGPSRAVPYFPRGSETINWMLEYPWIKDDVPPTSPPYEFSDVRDAFRHLALEVLGPDGGYAGFVVLSLSREKGLTTLQLNDHTPTLDPDVLFWLVMHQADRLDASVLVLPQELSSRASSLRLPGPLVRQHRRRYLCWANGAESELAGSLDDLSLSLTDGDKAFT